MCVDRSHMVERGYLLVRQPAVKRNCDLRLRGSAWQDTEHARLALPPDALDGYPVEQMRLFQLVDSRMLSCWHKPCSLLRGHCSRWTVNEASAIWNELWSELVAAVAARPPAEDSDRHVYNVNLVFTTSWLAE